MNTKQLLNSYFNNFEAWSDFRQIGSASASIAQALQNPGVHAFLSQNDVDLLLKQQERIDRYRFRVMDVDRILEANHWVPGEEPDSAWVNERRAKRILQFFCEQAENHALRTGTENKLAAVIQAHIRGLKDLKWNEAEGCWMDAKMENQYVIITLPDGLSAPYEPCWDGYLQRDMITWINEFVCTYFDNIGLRGTAAGDRKWDAFLDPAELGRSMTKLAERLQQRINVKLRLRQMRREEAVEQASIQ